MSDILSEDSVGKALTQASRRAAEGNLEALAGTKALRAQDVNVLISELLLDPENPRIAGQDAQIDIRQALIDDQGSKIAELADDIVTHRLNPMDRMMVYQPDLTRREFVALEGNRRVAALQILNNPSLLNDLDLTDALRDRLTELANRFDASDVEPIQAVRMPDRESANRWILLRHTGQNNGRGIVDWTAVQTARFRGDKTLQLLELVKKKGDLSEDDKNAIDSNFPITTLERLVANPVVRQRLGIQIADGEYFFTFPWEKVVTALKHITLELAHKRINVNSVRNREQQISYVESLPGAALPEGPRLDSPQPLRSLFVAQPAPSPPPVVRPSPSPLNRRTLVPKGFTLAIPNQKAAQIFVELRQLNIEKFPVGGAVLLRCFVEATADVYCLNKSISTKHVDGRRAGSSLSLSEKVEAVIADLSASMTAQDAKAARIALTDPKSVISVNRLNEYVHNPAVFPSRHDLIGSWSGIEPFFKAAWK